MSFEDGWAAINLEMPRRVPHTEYSLEKHWDYIKAITGLDVGPESPAELQTQAGLALVKALNYDFRWSTLLDQQPFGDLHTDMGHAEYEAGGVDWRDHIYCPFKTPQEVLEFDFWEAYGRIKREEWRARFEDHYRQRCLEASDTVNMTGIYTTLVSGLIEIFGWDMLLWSAGTDQRAFGELANRYAKWILQYFEALADADVPVVMVHDDIVDCGVHGLVLEPSTDMAYIAEKYGNTHVFIGNADTRALLLGTRADIRAEVERCISIGKVCPGFIMAVGNHIPSNTPVENVQYYMQVYEELSVR